MQIAPKVVPVTAFVSLVAISPSLAQQGNHQPANEQYMAAMKTMNARMKAVTDSDAAHAFAKKMIAHHEGAVAMSKIVLQYAKDRAIRNIAHQTIRENMKGIKNLRT